MLDELRSADESAWSVALNTNNLAGYEGYQRNCNSICAFRRNAERQVEQLRALENQQQQAQLKRADEAAWSAALQANILADYQRYLRNCNSVCAFRSNAERRVRELKDLENQRRQAELRDADQSAWKAASQADNLDAYQSYLSNCNQICEFKSVAEQQVEQMREFELTIRSEVGANEVWIDGRSYGSTPVSAQLTRGSYAVRVIKSGYLDYFEQIEFRQSRTLRVELERELAPGDIIQDCPECPKMVYIPAGSFRMGDIQGDSSIKQGVLVNGYTHQQPAHYVSIQDFLLGETEITFSQWDACVAAGGCSHKPDDKGCCSVEHGDKGWGRGSRRPVFNVSWEDITEQYIPWLNKTTGEQYRLPSEAEWEYAARAGSQTKYFFGNNSDDMCKYGNVADLEAKKQGDMWRIVDCNDGYYRTAPVASFTANAFGLYDMHGNVSEWAQDCWNGNYEGAPSDGSAWLSGDCSNRALRGSSWLAAYQRLRSDARGRSATDFRYYTVGFRLARTLD